MKYIKLFEGFNNLEDFCNSYLAYLLDEDFKFDITEMKGCCKLIISNDDIFNWDNVKDYIIPFFEVLCENYNVYNYIGIKNIGDIYSYPYNIKTLKDPSGYPISSMPIEKIILTINK